MQKLEFYILRMTIVFWFIFWGYILYSMFWPPIIFKYNVFPLPVNKQIVKAGETISYHGDYCKYVGSPGTVTHSLERKLGPKEIEQHISDIIIIFDAIKNTNPPMGCHTVDPEILIPSGIKPGTYRVNKNIHVKVNSFRIVDLEYVSDWFHVVQ